MAESEADQSRDSFSMFLRHIGEYLNTDSIGKQFGESDVNDNAKLNLANISRIPGSRGKGNARDDRGNGRKGNRRDANLTNWEDPNWAAGSHQIQKGEMAKMMSIAESSRINTAAFYLQDVEMGLQVF